MFTEAQNSILLNFPSTYPQTSGKERLLVKIGDVQKEYKAEVYETTNRIDAVNALVFKNVDHGTSLKFPDSFELEVHNVATPTTTGSDGVWNILLCDMNGFTNKNANIYIPSFNTS